MLFAVIRRPSPCFGTRISGARNSLFFTTSHIDFAGEFRREGAKNNAGNGRWVFAQTGVRQRSGGGQRVTATRGLERRPPPQQLIQHVTRTPAMREPPLERRGSVPAPERARLRSAHDCSGCVDSRSYFTKHKIRCRFEINPVTGLGISIKAPQLLFGAADPLCLDVPSGPVVMRTRGQIWNVPGMNFCHGSSKAI